MVQVPKAFPLGVGTVFEGVLGPVNVIPVQPPIESGTADLEVTLEHPFWGWGRLRVVLAARGWMVSEATGGRILSAARKRCPIWRAHRRSHDVGKHLSRRDMNTMGWEVPLAPSSPRATGPRRPPVHHSHYARVGVPIATEKKPTILHPVS